MVNVGVNGFGRIGRIFLRTTLKSDSPVKVVALNDPFMKPADMVNLLVNDSVHRKLDVSCEVQGDHLLIGGEQQIHYFSEKDPSKIPWEKNGVEVVVDCTGIFLTQETAKAHLGGTVKKVVMSAPPKDNTKMIVMGVNQNDYNNEEIVSNASCTTNCLAPIVKVLQNTFGISYGLMSTIHAVTITQPTVDNCSKKNKRLGFSALGNIIPSSTGAAKAVGKVIKDVEGKLTGMAYRVPVMDASVVDLTVKLEKDVNLGEVHNAVKAASQEQMKGIIRYDESDALVSTQVIGENHSCVYDAKACVELPKVKGFFKLVCWYDNEYGYSTRLRDLAGFVGQKK